MQGHHAGGDATMSSLFPPSFRTQLWLAGKEEKLKLGWSLWSRTSEHLTVMMKQVDAKSVTIAKETPRTKSLL